MNASQIVRETGISRKRVDKWLRLAELPERNKMEPKMNSPAFFRDYLARRWASGCHHVKTLLAELRTRGYTGCFSVLARFVSGWRDPRQVAAPTSEQRRASQRDSFFTCWPSRFIPCGRGASVEAPASLNAGPGAQGGCFEEVLPSFCPDARFGDAVPRNPSVRLGKRADRMDSQSKELRHLLSQEICQDTSPGLERGSKLSEGVVQQWPGGRAHQPVENAQAADVRSRRFRIAPRWSAPFCCSIALCALHQT